MSASNERVGIRGRVISSFGGLTRQQPPNLNFQTASGPNPPTSLKLSSHRTPEPSPFSRLTACHPLPSFECPERLSPGLRGVRRALERAAKRRPHHLPAKQLSPKPRAKPAPPSLPSLVPRRARGRWRGRGQGRESAPGRTKPPARTLHAAGGQKEPLGLQKPRAPCPRPMGKVQPPRRAPRLGRAPQLAHGTSPTSHRGLPRPARPAATKYPLSRWCSPSPLPRRPNLLLLPTMGSPTPPAAASETRPGRRRRSPGRSSPRPPTCLPPLARPQPGGHLENRAYFSRACPSEGTAEPLPLANMVCREEGAEPRRRRRYHSGCSRAAPRSRPPPRRSPASSLALSSPRSPPSPPRRWLRALSSCQSVSPGRGPIALELLPRRLGLGCRCRRRRRRSPAGTAACWLSRAPVRPAPPAPPSAPPAPLPPPLPLVYLELNRTWLPRLGSEAGVNDPRLIATPANRRPEAGPGRSGRDALSALGRGSPCCRRLHRAATPASAGGPGISGGANLFSVDVGRGIGMWEL